MESPFAMTFEEIMAQADANMKKDKEAEAKAPAQKSFADLVEEAKRQLGEIMETPAPEAPKEEAPKAEAPKAEAQASASMSFEDLFKAASSMAGTGSGSEAEEEAAKAEAEAEAKAKAEAEAKKKAEEEAAKAKAEVKAETSNEPLPDLTDSYKVDLHPETSKPETLPPIEALFTKEEIEAFRKDIRTLVRFELKAALVGAVKEMLREFHAEP